MPKVEEKHNNQESWDIEYEYLKRNVKKSTNKALG